MESDFQFITGFFLLIFIGVWDKFALTGIHGVHSEFLVYIFVVPSFLSVLSEFVNFLSKNFAVLVCFFRASPFPGRRSRIARVRRPWLIILVSWVSLHPKMNIHILSFAIL